MQSVAGVQFFDNWISDNKGQSTKVYTIVAPLGATLSFDWSVSSEPIYDKLIVTLDGTILLEKSGEDNGTFTQEIPQGEHILEAKYVKDESNDEGLDQATLSNVKIDFPEVIDGVAYKCTNNNAVTVISVADDTDIEIPATITINNDTYNVTEISETAFSFCSNLTTVTILAEITEIKAGTFENCSKLTSVTLPTTLTTIGCSAFKGCSSLANITIPDAVTSIGEGAFSGCRSLSAVILPKSLATIGEAAFMNCVSLSSISDIPNTVTTIAYSTFEGCTALTTITLPTALTAIGSSAFKGCSTLNDITIPNTVTSVGESAFQECTSLVAIVLPAGVTSISSKTFSGCTNLTSIDIPQTMTYIGSYAFYDCGNMQTMTIPTSVYSIGSNAFTGCGGEQYLNCQTSYNSWGGSDGAYYDSKITKITIGANITNINSYAFFGCRNLSEVILPNTVTTIGRNAFDGTNLSTIELPATIKTIGYNAFPSSMSKMTCNATTPPTLETENGNGTPSLGNISIIYVPQGGSKQVYKDTYPWSSKTILDGSENPVVVTVRPGEMGEEILKQINYLADVNFLTLSGAINDVDIANIKNSMPNLVSIDMSGLDMKNIPSDMFFERKALLSIILPQNVETIGAYAFNGCINLESIVLPEGLKKIENGNSGADINGQYYGNAGSFSNCSSLKSVLFPSTLEGVGNYAFYGCNRLQKVEFKEGATYVGSYAFASCSSLNDLTLPNSLKNIGEAAFIYCTSLRNITIPEGVTSIGYRYANNGSGVFAYCSSLRQITLPKGLQEICQGTFYGCSSLTTLDIPEGVTFIGRDAFNGCSNLVSVSLPGTLSSCGSTPFANCNKLSEVSCLALLPPMLTDGLLTLENMGLPLKRTLKVPEWTINRYKLTSGWAAFTQIEPIIGIYPSSINVVSDAVLTLPAIGLPANYRPDMVISANGGYVMDGMYHYSASLHLKGTGTLQLNTFSMISNDMMGTAGTQLLNEAQMEAESVSVGGYLSSYSNGDYYGSSNNGWYFLSFPFDVKISDVSTNCEWVVRQYDGKARANNKLDNTWVNIPQSNILNAGQGYIWACSGGYFTINAVDNANKNLIFANAKREIPLKEYASEHVANSGWNLVGNPYPCHYNIQHMDFAAPITVWDRSNNTYAAYSPVDDNYTLSPFEAFFVQCPENVDKIGFEPTGRQLSATPTTTNPVSTARAMSKNSDRHVINIELSNEHYTDRTRLVINKDAQMAYELECDAAKFMSTDAAMQQIYTIYNDEMFSINERPIGDGIVMLGTQFAKAGTYTIAMQSTSEMVAILVDKKNGKEIDLNVEEYTFEAEATDTNRFSVRLYHKDDATAVETVKNKTEISCVGNTIIVAGSADANVEVYNMAGALVASGGGNNFTFNAESGVYIVKVNGTAKKVAVGK